MANETTDIQSAIAAGTALAGVQKLIPGLQSAPVFVLPSGYALRIPAVSELEPHLERPLRKRGKFCFTDGESFIRYFNEQKTDDSRIFAEVTDNGALFRGILDFHGAQPNFREHTAEFELEPTAEWTRFTAQNGKAMTQSEFVTFLEDNADSFSKPNGADLMELIQTLEGKAHVDFKSAVRPNSSSIKLSYTEEVELKGGNSSQSGDITLPTILELTMSPFHGVPPLVFQARLRYKIESRKLHFWYNAVSTHLVVRAVVDKLLHKISDETKVEPFKS